MAGIDRSYTLPGLVLLAGMLWAAACAGQTAPDTWWVQFTDKDNTPYTLDQPEAFLSPRAIQRRQVQGIAMDELDLPVDPAYINAVLALGQVQLVNRSRWFNAITIRTDDAAVLDAIQQLPFVQQVRATRRLTGAVPAPPKFQVDAALVERGGGGDYGVSYLQVAMMNGHLLHELEAKGQGMLIGVLDSGFEDANVLAGFSELLDREGIVFTRDMVDHDGDVYQDHWHGRSVLSCMAAVVPGELVGTAPLADYALVRTEEVGSEYLVEEDHWISGAEVLDSLGCDILNTSLGYTVFDDSLQNHVYEELDGSTIRISIAGGIASSKGMIPVTSAGNQGAGDWYYISAPADAIDILAVGAVGAQEQHAWFSSHGPSADGRVKPDVAAMGWGTYGLGVDGTLVEPLNGTSFSAPLVAGLVACLWQLHPGRTAQDVMDAVRRSASLWSDPTPELGYGIPNFMYAHELLQLGTGMADEGAGELHVFPVPFSDRLTILLPSGYSGRADIVLHDAMGRQVWSRQGQWINHGGHIMGDEQLAALGNGLYVLRVRTDAGELVRTVVKAP
jgi:serine protease AprX